MKPPYKPSEVVGNFTIIKCLNPNCGTGMHRYYRATCNHCNKVITIRSSCLKKQDGCGCTAIEKARIRATKHGHYYNRLYRIWYGMIKRCEDNKDQDYRLYGGRGIRVCEEWKDYDRFYRWAIYNGYKQNLSIERKDVNGDYCPKNCKWVSLRMQATNKRNSRRTDYGESLTELAATNNVKKLRQYGLKVWAKAVKKRAGFKCELCGKRGDYTTLDAHHWYATRASHAPTDLMLSNGICLCRTCHIKAHNEPAKYKHICMQKKIKVKSFIARLEEQRNKVFDCEQAVEAIKRCEKIMKE